MSELLSRERPTGRMRHRADSEGCLILQIEVEHIGRAPIPAWWRDARTEDITVITKGPRDDSWADRVRDVVQP